jgi:hypothetical protein
VEPLCVKTDGKLMINALITTRFSKSKPDVAVWRIDCDLQTNQCHGAKLDVGLLQRDRRLWAGSPGLYSTDRVSIGSDYTITLDPYRKLVLPADLSRVVFEYTDPNETGRGEASCQESAYFNLLGAKK